MSPRRMFWASVSLLQAAAAVSRVRETGTRAAPGPPTGSTVELSGGQWSLFSMSDRPTVTRPPITNTIPAHLNQARRARRKIVERIPAHQGSF